MSAFVKAYSSHEIANIRILERNHAIKLGIAVGCFLALIVSAVVGISLDIWRQANDERLRAEAVASVERRLATCRSIVERTTGQDYGSVAQLAERIDAARGGVR